MQISKKILIVGASGGIGQSLVGRLKLGGAKLFLVGRNEEKLRIFAQSVSADYSVCDLSKADESKNLFERVSNSLGTLDGIVNLAGSIILKPAHLTSEAEWDSVIAQNLTTAFNCVRYGVPKLAPNSSVVLMSSAAARIGLANHEAIAAAKAGIIGLTQSAAATYAAKGIRFNCVAPGLVRTELSSKITSNPASEKASLSLHPLKRLGEPADIAPLIEFLLSDLSSWISGQTIAADGGLADLKTLQP